MAATKSKVARFVSPVLAEKHPHGYIQIGRPLTGMQFQSVEIVCELGELREILTSVWFVALSRRRLKEDEPIALTITTEIP